MQKNSKINISDSKKNLDSEQQHARWMSWKAVWPDKNSEIRISDGKKNLHAEQQHPRRKEWVEWLFYLQKKNDIARTVSSK